MTLVAGCYNNKHKRQGGFSLLEMLIVILVVGLLYSFAGSMLTLSVSDPMTAEVDRLRERVQLAQDETLVRSQPLALGFYEHGYGFFVQNEENQQWQPLKQDDLLGVHAIPDNFEQVLFLQGQAVRLPAEKALQPQVFILPTGEMMGFEWQLLDGKSRKSSVQFDTSGRLVDAANKEN